jgi:hypothetical protein
MEMNRYSPSQLAMLIFAIMDKKKEKRPKTISDELDDIIEMKKNEASAWKKIAESLKNETENKLKNRKT